MRFVVNFDKGTVDYDNLRPDPLVLSRGGAAEVVQLGKGLGYDREIRHVVDAVSRRKRGLTAKLGATLDDAVRVARLLDAERESLRMGRPVRVARR
jgi:predicted dehydrogenase